MKLPALLLTLCLVSCSALPEIHQGTAVPPGNLKERLDPCERIFASGKWRFVHSIEATLAGHRKTFLLGVTQVSAADESLHCVLMTIEGLVLFEAMDNGKLSVTRAVPPFDAEVFARGLMRDVALLLLRPKGDLEKTGILENGNSACRYRLKTEGEKDWVTDVIKGGKDRWILRQYQGRSLCRTLTATYEKNAGEESNGRFPQRLVLTAFRPGRYELKLKLVEARPIN